MVVSQLWIGLSLLVVRALQLQQFMWINILRQQLPVIINNVNITLALNRARMKHDTNIISNLFNNLQLWGLEPTSCMHVQVCLILFIFSAHHAKIEVNHYDRAVLTIFWSFCTFWLFSLHIKTITLSNSEIISDKLKSFQVKCTNVEFKKKPLFTVSKWHHAQLFDGN